MEKQVRVRMSLLGKRYDNQFKTFPSQFSAQFSERQSYLSSPWENKRVPAQVHQEMTAGWSDSLWLWSWGDGSRLCWASKIHCCVWRSCTACPTCAWGLYAAALVKIEGSHRLLINSNRYPFIYFTRHVRINISGWRILFCVKTSKVGRMAY